MNIPKGYRQRQAAALARSRQRIVSAEVREQRAKFLAHSAGTVEPEPAEVVVAQVVPVPTPDVPAEPAPEAPETPPAPEATEAAEPPVAPPVVAPEAPAAPEAEPVKNKGGRPKKQA